MATGICPACHAQLNDGAARCPRCGAGPDEKPLGFVLGTMLLVAVVLVAGGLQRENTPRALHAVLKMLDPRTGKPAIDLHGDIFVRAGAAVCPSEAALGALRPGVGDACLHPDTDLSVATLEMRGFALPVFHVRFLGDHPGQAGEAWVAYPALRN